MFFFGFISQNYMREFQFHGITLARKHLRDWLILIILIAMLTSPSNRLTSYRFIRKDMMNDIKYPHKPNTMSSWAIPVCFYVSETFNFIQKIYEWCSQYDVQIYFDRLFQYNALLWFSLDSLFVQGMSMILIIQH